MQCDCHECDAKHHKNMIDLTKAMTPKEIRTSENTGRQAGRTPTYRVDEWSKGLKEWIEFCPAKTIEDAIGHGNDLVASGISARVVNLETGETPWEVSNL